jgi:hypothetical protein
MKPFIYNLVLALILVGCSGEWTPSSRVDPGHMPGNHKYFNSNTKTIKPLDGPYVYFIVINDDGKLIIPVWDEVRGRKGFMDRAYSEIWRNDIFQGSWGERPIIAPNAGDHSLIVFACENPKKDAPWYMYVDDRWKTARWIRYGVMDGKLLISDNQAITDDVIEIVKLAIIEQDRWSVF